MIFYKKNELAARYYGCKNIGFVYKGTKLIWEAIRSCFGGGSWRSDKPWKDSDAWK